MEPIYRSVVQDHEGWDPRDLTTFDLEAFLASHRGPQGVPKPSRPRKAARRANRR